MEGEASWDIYPYNYVSRGLGVAETFPEVSDESDKNSMVSLDFILPDDLLERILAYLPIASIIRAGSVSKRWNGIVNSKSFLCSSNILSQKPWYFMFTSGDVAEGYAFDPVLRKWYGLELPCIETSNCLISSSYGLVCFMDNDSRGQLFICNAITKEFKKLKEPPGLKSDYSALALSVDRKSHCYTVGVVKSKQVPENFLQWDLSIHLYDSETETWVSPKAEVFTGWRGGDESVVCGGVLYCLIYSTKGFGVSEIRHGLIIYDLLRRSSNVSLLQSWIPVPCSLTCGRLMNLKDKLVMVGGIGKHDRPDIIKGIGIWTLNKEEWQEVSRMPHKFFQGFGEFDDVFASSGTDDLIYIQSYGAPALLTFDMKQRQWKWSQKCPVAKRFPLQLFTGFCFEPRLEVAP